MTSDARETTEPHETPKTLHTALVLAAGFGTRLRPFTHETPKPLLPVLGRPLIHYALEHARRAGCTEVIINAHHLRDAFPDVLGDTYAGMHLRYSLEEKILGTGGGLARMMSLTDAPGPFLVLNADALCDFDVHVLIESHFSTEAAETMLLKRTADMADYGTIGTDATGRVVDFVGRASAPGTVSQRGMFVGAHVMERAVCAPLSPDEESCINTAGVPALMEAGHRVQGVYTVGDFSDVGTPERLWAANRQLLDGTFSHRFLPRPEAVRGRMVDPSASVHPEAQLHRPVFVGAGASVAAGAEIGPEAIIGPGAVVSAGVRVAHAVLMSGARAEADTHRSLRSAEHTVCLTD